ncbi:MAG: 50S ribosomal protein L10, partial [Clostridia bacterium]|nr:50S ribosomal protein L10 [Clostridia bacterium]
MPSAAVLEQKKQIVVELTEKLKGSCAGVVVDYKGISVADDTVLRKSLREAGIDYFVVKNSLLGFAADEATILHTQNLSNKQMKKTYLMP